MPYHSCDFDFDTAKQFLDSDYGQNAKGKKGADEDEPASKNQQLAPQRRDSGETLLTETATMREKDQGDLLDEDEKLEAEGHLNYRKL